MKTIEAIFISSLIAMGVIATASAQSCVFCEPPQRPINAPAYPLIAAPIVIPQLPSNDAVSRYLDAQANATNESLSIYKYQSGILSNPQANQQINLDRMMQDFRSQIQGRR